MRRAAVVGARLLPDHRDDCVTFRSELMVRGTWGDDRNLPVKSRWVYVRFVG